MSKRHEQAFHKTGTLNGQEKQEKVQKVFILLSQLGKTSKNYPEPMFHSIPSRNEHEKADNARCC